MSEKKPQQTWTPGQYLAAAAVAVVATIIIDTLMGTDGQFYRIGFGTAAVLAVIGIIGAGTAAGRKSKGD